MLKYINTYKFIIQFREKPNIYIQLGKASSFLFKLLLQNKTYCNIKTKENDISVNIHS
jgi:hypothetical protein